MDHQLHTQKIPLEQPRITSTRVCAELTSRTKNERVVKALETRISELQAEKVKVDEATAKSASPSRELDKTLEPSMHFLAPPYGIRKTRYIER